MKRIITAFLTALMVFCAVFPLPAAAAEKEDAVYLGKYWTENSQAAQALEGYIEKVTDPDSESFIPEEDRIAVFDLDGTLMCETYPWCFEYMIFADYVLNHEEADVPVEVRAVAQEIVDSAWGEKPANMSTRQAAAAAVAYKGMEPEDVIAMAEAFQESEAEGFSGLKRGDAWYLPMMEFVDYLQANGFEIYIVTATERNVVRGAISGKLNIPRSHVIGTEYGYTATGQGEVSDGNYTFQHTDTLVFDGSYYGENAKTCKVDAIIREIGQKPVLAFGNSSGDEAMMQYVITDNRYESLAGMVLADDEVREHGKASNAEKREGYEADGYLVISMKDDFDTIYGTKVKNTLPEILAEKEAEPTPGAKAEEVTEAEEKEAEAEKAEVKETAAEEAEEKEAEAEKAEVKETKAEEAEETEEPAEKAG